MRFFIHFPGEALRLCRKPFHLLFQAWGWIRHRWEWSWWYRRRWP